MVEIDLPIQTEGHTFVIVAGIDGAVPQKELRIDLSELVKMEIRPVISETDNLQVKFMERLTRDEREMVGLNAQYAVKVIIDPRRKGIGDPAGVIETVKKRVKSLLRENGFIVTGTTSMIA